MKPGARLGEEIYLCFCEEIGHPRKFVRRIDDLPLTITSGFFLACLIKRPVTCEVLPMNTQISDIGPEASPMRNYAQTQTIRHHYCQRKLAPREFTCILRTNFAAAPGLVNIDVLEERL
jgi:hypothetical protein